MIKPAYRSVFLVLLPLLFYTSSSFADVVMLKNGDHISGKLVKKTADSVIISTDYAGDISVKSSEVTHISTEQPVYLKLRNGQEAIQALDSTAMDLAAIEVVYREKPAAPPALRHKGRANVGINVSEGNTETERYHVDTEWIARSARQRYTTGLVFNSATDTGVKTADNTRLYGKVDHFINGRWYLYGNLEFYEDSFKDIDLRTTFGFGSGYQFYESDEMNLAVEGGISHVNEKQLNGLTDRHQSARWAVKFDRQLYRRFAQFFHEHVGTLDLEDTANLEITSKTGLRFPLVLGLAATAQLDLDWDNQPSAGKDRLDSRYLINLGYSW